MAPQLTQLLQFTSSACSSQAACKKQKIFATNDNSNFPSFSSQLDTGCFIFTKHQLNNIQENENEL